MLRRVRIDDTPPPAQDQARSVLGCGYGSGLGDAQHVCCMSRVPGACHVHLVLATSTWCMPRAPGACHKYLLHAKCAWCMPRVPGACHVHLVYEILDTHRADGTEHLHATPAFVHSNTSSTRSACIGWGRRLSYRTEVSPPNSNSVGCSLCCLPLLRGNCEVLRSRIVCSRGADTPTISMDAAAPHCGLVRLVRQEGAVSVLMCGVGDILGLVRMS